MTDIKEIDIKTEDNAIVHPGDRVYNYYDMWPGKIVEYTQGMIDALRDDDDIKRDRWFYVQKDGAEGMRGCTLLNGERICTIAFARGRGFRDA
jgi:hypothetical protein